jgi:hypothetical protein
VTLNSEPQHIVSGGRSSSVSHSNTIGCGTEAQPWTVEALAGQRIAVSLIDIGMTPFYCVVNSVVTVTGNSMPHGRQLVNMRTVNIFYIRLCFVITLFLS